MPYYSAGGDIVLNAFKDGLTILNQDNLNSLLALQPFQLIYEGGQRAAKTGSGVVENNMAEHSYCTRFILTGSTEIGRVELEIDRDGTGADLIVQIRSGMDPVNGADGALLKQVVIPKEFIPAAKAYWSVPIGLSGLTSGGAYWLVVLRAGDATNKLEWMGEASQDANYPAYQRAGDTGAWSAAYALHFCVLSGTTGKAVHEVYGTNGHVTMTYSGDVPAKQYFYIPPADGSAGGVRNILTLSYIGGVLTGGAL